MTTKHQKWFTIRYVGRGHENILAFDMACAIDTAKHFAKVCNAKIESVTQGYDVYPHRPKKSS